MFFFFYKYFSRIMFFFFFSSRRRHTRSDRDWSSDVCSSDLSRGGEPPELRRQPAAAGRGESGNRRGHLFPDQPGEDEPAGRGADHHGDAPAEHRSSQSPAGQESERDERDPQDRLGDALYRHI